MDIPTGKLFATINSNINVYEKLSEIMLCFDDGADINGRDINSHSDTPLHAAVLQKEPALVTFLLKKGADPEIENNKSETPLKLAKALDFDEIVLLLKERMNVSQPTSKVSNEGQKCYFKRKSSVAGLKGQLYETKLMSLVLLRLLNSEKSGNIDDFVLGCNVSGMGLFDDIVLNVRAKEKQKTYFVQVKHKEINTKLDDTNITAATGGFSLSEYFRSYLTIKENITESKILKKLGVEMDDVNLILFTQAKQDFDVSKLKNISNSEPDDLFFTTSNGKIIQFDYSEEYVNCLFKTEYKERIKQLAKVFVETVNSGEQDFSKYHALLKTYHVFLSLHVVDVAKGTFLNDFYSNTSETVTSLRQSIYKILLAGDYSGNKNLSQTIHNLRDYKNRDDTLRLLIGTAIKYDFGSKQLYWNKKGISNKLFRSIDLSSFNVEREKIMEALSEKIVNNNKEYDLKTKMKLCTRFMLSPSAEKLAVFLGDLVYYKDKKIHFHDDVPQHLREIINLHNVDIPVEFIEKIVANSNITKLKFHTLKSIEDFKSKPSTKTLGPLLSEVLNYRNNKVEFDEYIPKKFRLCIKLPYVTHIIIDIKERLNDLKKKPTLEKLCALLGDLIVYDPVKDRLVLSKNVPEDISKSYELPVLSSIIVEKAIRIAGEKEARLMKFNLPEEFGNVNFRVTKPRRLQSLAKFIVQLLEQAENQVVRIKDDNNKMLELSKDIVTKLNGGIAGLVGNLLVLDPETNLLKFNDDMRTLPCNATQLLKIIKDRLSKGDPKLIDISKFRFDITLNDFPKLNLIDKGNDMQLVEEFLEKLRFYTNQAEHNQLEHIIEDNMKLYIERHLNLNNSVFSKESFLNINKDAIYLKLQDSIQKWWSSRVGYCLTKSSDIVDKAARHATIREFLNVSKILCLRKMSRYNISFENKHFYNLRSFLNGRKDTAIIKTVEIDWSVIKVTQCLSIDLPDYFLLDMSLPVVHTNVHNIKNDLIEFRPEVLVVVCNDDKILIEILQWLREVVRKLIVITDSVYKMDDAIVIDDRSDSMALLDGPSQEAILTKSFMIRGKLIPWHKVISDNTLYLVCSKLCIKILNTGVINVDKPVERDCNEAGTSVQQTFGTFDDLVLNKEQFEEVLREFYVWRHVDDRYVPVSRPKPGQDVLIIRPSKTHNINDYTKYRGHNIHFFKMVQSQLQWYETVGSRSKLEKYRNSISLQDISDLRNNVVVLVNKALSGESVAAPQLSIDRGITWCDRTGPGPLLQYEETKLKRLEDIYVGLESAFNLLVGSGWNFERKHIKIDKYYSDYFVNDFLRFDERKKKEESPLSYKLKGLLKAFHTSNKIDLDMHENNIVWLGENKNLNEKRVERITDFCKDPKGNDEMNINGKIVVMVVHGFLDKFAKAKMGNFYQNNHNMD